MLANVRFFNFFFIRLFLIFVLISISFSLSANEKNQIITKLNNLNSLEFTFNQIINEKIEKGNCILEFPGKLKCNYFDDKQKELDRKSTRLNTSHTDISRMPSSA